MADFLSKLKSNMGSQAEDSSYSQSFTCYSEDEKLRKQNSRQCESHPSFRSSPNITSGSLKNIWSPSCDTQSFAEGGAVKAQAKKLANMGRDGDTQIAEIGPRTAEMMDNLVHRGHKQINPRTGLREYCEKDPACSLKDNHKNECENFSNHPINTINADREDQQFFNVNHKNYNLSLPELDKDKVSEAEDINFPHIINQAGRSVCSHASFLTALNTLLPDAELTKAIMSPASFSNYRTISDTKKDERNIELLGYTDAKDKDKDRMRKFLDSKRIDRLQKVLEKGSKYLLEKKDVSVSPPSRDMTDDQKMSCYPISTSMAEIFGLDYGDFRTTRNNKISPKTISDYVKKTILDRGVPVLRFVPPAEEKRYAGHCVLGKNTFSNSPVPKKTPVYKSPVPKKTPVYKSPVPEKTPVYKSSVSPVDKIKGSQYVTVADGNFDVPYPIRIMNPEKNDGYIDTHASKYRYTDVKLGKLSKRELKREPNPLEKDIVPPPRKTKGGG